MQQKRKGNTPNSWPCSPMQRDDERRKAQSSVKWRQERKIVKVVKQAVAVLQRSSTPFASLVLGRR